MVTTTNTILKQDADSLYRMRASITKRLGDLEIFTTVNPLFEHAKLYLPGENVNIINQLEATMAGEDRGGTRSTTRWRRHECYRRCLKAQRLALHDILGNWTEIENLFSDAASVVDRHGGPADMQALAQTRLLHAEHCVRRGELIVASMRSRIMAKNLALKTEGITIFSSLDGYINEAKRLGIFEINLRMAKPVPLQGVAQLSKEMLDAAYQCLIMADETLKAGRGENNATLSCSLTQARWRMLKALLTAEATPGRAMADVRQAAYHLSSALANCGRLTDRRLILTHWWQAIKSFIYLLSADSTLANEEIRRLLAITGMRWSMGGGKVDPPASVGA